MQKDYRTVKVFDGPRNVAVLLGGDLSKMRMIKSGVPQGLVLAPTFFDIYTADIPDTISRKYTYADDLAAACQARET